MISPIGQPKSTERRHADHVLERIITPAMTELGFRPYRIDHRPAAASIMNATIDALRDAEMCVAIVTYDNPNVMFELGVRQAWDLPVVQMARQGTSLPFDIQSCYTVFYSLSKVGINAAIEELKRVWAEIDGVHGRAEQGTVPRHSLPFGDSMLRLGQRYSLHAVFEAKRSVIDFLINRLHTVQSGIADDYEMRHATATVGTASPHRNYIEAELRDVRIKCIAFELIAGCRMVTDACRARCTRILTAIKQLMTFAAGRLTEIFGPRRRTIKVQELKDFLDQLIEQAGRLRGMLSI